jgi:hypothetical protein
VHGAAVVIAVAATCALTAGAAAACSATTGTRKPPAAATAAARAVHGPHFYVSLGDSLSQGVQPDATGGSAAARQGYPDQLYAVLRRGAAGLRLVLLGRDNQHHDPRRDMPLSGRITARSGRPSCVPTAATSR